MRQKLLVVALSFFFVALPLISRAETFTRPLDIGASGSDVSALQQILKGLGYFTYPTITGYFGDATAAAVIAYQQAQGLEPVGSVGPQTRALLNAIPSAPSSARSSLSVSQIQSILGLLQSFGADSSIIANVSAALGASTPASGSSTSAAAATSTTYIPAATSLPDYAPGQIIFIGGASPSPVTQPATLGTVTTTAASSIATSTAILGGAITATGGANASQSGFAYGTSATLATTIATSTLGSQTGMASFIQNLTGLTPNTTYYFRAYTANSAGTSYGSLLSFTTNALPTISSIATSSVATSTITITWTTNVAATSQINYGLTTSYGSASSSAALVTSHSITLTGLSSMTNYDFQVLSLDSGGNIATSSNQTLTTAATYYVNSSGGSDSNNGQSLATAFLTLQHAADVTAPGNTVCIENGNGYGGGTSGVAPLIISTSGTSGKPVTYSGCNGMQPITSSSDPNMPVISGTQAAGDIYGVYPLSYITINGLNLAGWNSSLTWAGASANAGASGSGWQSNVYGGSATFFAGGTSGHTLHDLTMTNNFVHDFPGEGLGCSYCDHVSISGNTIFNTSYYSPWETSGISLYELHDSDANTGTKNILSGNTIFNNHDLIPGHSSIQGITTASFTSTGNTYLPVANSAGANYTEYIIDVTNGCIPPGTQVAYFGSGYIGLTQANTCNINNNDVIQFGYVTDGEGVIVDNNTNTQSDSIAYGGRTLVENNVIFNNGSSGLQCAPQSNNCDFAFNTLYDNQTSFLNDSAAAGEIGDQGTNGSNFYNNILVATSTAPSGWNQSAGTTVWSSNLFFGGNASHTLPGSNNVMSNPLFVSPGITSSANFQLQGSSPAIGAASNAFTRSSDFGGNAVTTPDSIGAY